MVEKKQKVKVKSLTKNLKRTWKYAKKSKKYLIGFVGAAVILSVISAIVPLFDAKILLNLTEGNFKALIVTAVIVFCIETSRNFGSFISGKMGQLFFRNTLLVLQQEIAKETVELEIKSIDDNSSGIFMDRLNNDTEDIADVFAALGRSLTMLIGDLGVLVAMFIVSKLMFLYFIIALSILFVFKKLQWELMFKSHKQYKEMAEKNTGLISELVRGIRDIKVLNAGSIFIKRVFERLKQSNEERYKMTSIRRKYDLIHGNLSNVMMLIFFAYGIILYNANLLSIASFVIFYMYRPRVTSLLNTTSYLLEIIKKFDLSATRVFEVIEDNIYPKESFGTQSLPNVHGNFEFKNVTFGYEPKTPVLKNLSFKVNANETVAFVGKSGGGKTTIFSLLTKLYKANKGKITIDGVDINKLDCESIRGNISIITQSPYIFNFSIKDNLNIVKSDLTDEEMIEACKTARIHDFIMTLPEKYDTIVGEGGHTLSGGQRQRLAIARALIKKTEIILFDEATSALDNETQHEIQTAINNMKKEYTILIIAHRLSTIIDSDRIIMIEDGEITAEGTHQQLMKKNKEYKKLYETETIES